MLTGIVNVGAAMPTIHASEFKARCLATMDSVVSKGEVRVVTKNGLPMPAWHPYASERSGPPFGLRPKLERLIMRFGRLGQEGMEERFQQAFATDSGVVHELEEAQIEREFFL